MTTARRRTFSLKALQQRCSELRAHIEARELAAVAELNAVQPGSTDNPERDTWAWVRYYGSLCQFLTHHSASLGSMDEEEADHAVMDALRNEPLDVTLTALDPTTKCGRQVQVYPKSLDALLNCHARNQLLGWLAERLWALKVKGGATEQSYIERVTSELSYQYSLLVWIVTTPGVGMPFAPSDEHPVPPEWILALEPYDYIRLCQAHAAVNARRLMLLDVLIEKKTIAEEGQVFRPSWSVFISRLSKQLRIPPSRLMRDYSLAELSASTLLGQPPAAAPEEADEELADA